MITLDPAWAVLTWLLFSLVLIWALREGLRQFTQWLEHSSDGDNDLQFFPDEVRCEPGPGVPAAPRGEATSLSEPVAK